MAKNLEYALLLDCYGDFLTPHQLHISELYYGRDLTLGEIAELEGITRQGVRDAVKRSEGILEEMESKLHFAQRLGTIREHFYIVQKALDTALADTGCQSETRAECAKAKEILLQTQELL